MANLSKAPIRSTNSRKAQNQIKHIPTRVSAHHPAWQLARCSANRHYTVGIDVIGLFDRTPTSSSHIMYNIQHLYVHKSLIYVNQSEHCQQTRDDEEQTTYLMV